MSDREAHQSQPRPESIAVAGAQPVDDPQELTNALNLISSACAAAPASLPQHQSIQAALALVISRLNSQLG